ncbi:MAG: DUF1684 domain-containing protein [Pyrinomonadaceae bacterium]
MERQIALVLIFSILFVGACRNTAAPVTTFNESDYKQQIQKWRTGRLASLIREDSWLTLVGLFWLDEGENRFGSGAKNAIVLPQNKTPLVAGAFWLKDGRVRLAAESGAGITTDGKPLDDAAKTVELRDDTDDRGPTVLKLGTLIINVVKRSDRVGVRVKDTQSAARLQFKGLEYFPVDPKSRIEASFERYEPPKTIPITNVLSMTDNETSPGALAFEVGGQTYRIDPILEKGETDLFVMIADGTTGTETYGAGRYLYVPPPDDSGKVVIDFNKAYNPPCAFTNYATCPLPPRQNHLPFRIEAGEKKYAGTVH